jgi:hypothetical protein
MLVVVLAHLKDAVIVRTTRERQMMRFSLNLYIQPATLSFYNSMEQSLSSEAILS